jgi:hypothetical protein
MQDPLSIDSVFRLVIRKEVTPTAIYANGYLFDS